MYLPTQQNKEANKPNTGTQTKTKQGNVHNLGNNHSISAIMLKLLNNIEHTH
jgi:hypothetical protein